MSVVDQDLKKTPLFDKHVELGARMVPFSGWNMPVQYTGIIEEHLHTRTKASIFDICHMGEFFLRGPGAEKAVDRLVTCRIDDMPDGKCRYGFLLNANGGIVDDLIVFRLNAEEFMLVVNAGTIDKDREWVRENIPSRVDFSDVSEKTGKLDIQGPLSGEIMSGIVGEKVIGGLKRYYFTNVEIGGIKVLLSRTGYTGELGYELFCPIENVPELWTSLTVSGEVMPNGLGARDTLRLEMGYSLYGSDIDEKHTPIEANLERFVSMDKGFIGKEALLKQKNKGFKRQLTGFVCDSRRSARSHFSVLSGENIIGEVTSGAFSPCMKVAVGLGYVDRINIIEGNDITLSDGKIEIPAKIKNIPLYHK